MREIRRMIIAGYSHTEIQRQLNLPVKTYYRYFDSCFKEDRAHMTQSITPTESLTQLAIVQEHLNSLYHNMKSIAENPNVEPESRNEAANLAAELAVGILKSWEDSPLGGLGVLRRVETKAENHGLLHNNVPALDIVPYEDLKREVERRERIDTLSKERIAQEREERERKLREKSGLS